MYDKIDKESDRMNLVDSLNDRQKEAVVNTDGPMLILAGAGSGKTKVLTTKVAYLIEEKNWLDAVIGLPANWKGIAHFISKYQHFTLLV